MCLKRIVISNRRHEIDIYFITMLVEHNCYTLTLITLPSLRLSSRCVCEILMSIIRFGLRGFRLHTRYSDSIVCLIARHCNAYRSILLSRYDGSKGSNVIVQKFEVENLIEIDSISLKTKVCVCICVHIATSRI